MASRLATASRPTRTASAQIVVYPDTAIGTVARLLGQAGGGAARVVDPRSGRVGVAVAQDVVEAARLGAGREPVSRLVIWSEGSGERPRLPSPPLRLVRHSPEVEAPTLTAPSVISGATDVPEPLRLDLPRRRR